MSSDNPTSQVYANRLLEEVGYPLWHSGLQNVPPQKCLFPDGGVSMDYVDKITGDEAFKYKFNICADTGDAIWTLSTYVVFLLISNVG